MIERVLHSLADRFNPRQVIPHEFGISEPHVASTVVYDVTSHFLDGAVRHQPTWMTTETDDGATGINWLIGPNGRASRIGIFWDNQDPVVVYREGLCSYVLEDQSPYWGTFPVPDGDRGKVVVVRQLADGELKITRLLFAKMPHGDWEEMSMYVLTNALVSGVGRNVGGPMRDFITRYKPSDPPLLQELKQRSPRTR